MPKTKRKPGRPRLAAGWSRPFSITLPEETIAQIKALAEEEGCSSSHLVRRGITLMQEELEDAR